MLQRLPILTLLLLASTGGAIFAGDKETLFVAKPFTAVNTFTAGIEGPGCDQAGNVFVVNFVKQQTIGKVTPDGKTSLFVTLPGKSTGNGIVFDRQGFMYVADYCSPHRYA